MSDVATKPLEDTPHHASLRGKILLTVAGTCLFAILLASLALFAHQALEQRAQFRRDMEALSRIVADYSVAPISFGDDNGMRDALAVLQSRSEVVEAELSNLQGDTLHRFGASELDESNILEPDELSRYIGWQLLV